MLPCGADDADTSSPTLEETSILSNATDEGLDMSQRLTESIFIGPDIDAEGEEIVSGTDLIDGPFCHPVSYFFFSRLVCLLACANCIDFKTIHSIKIEEQTANLV